MRNVTLMDVFTHPIAQKYLQRSGVAHAIACAFHAYRLAVKAGVSPDLAAKAALLHDVGHYEWYTDGKWDYEKYRRNDIHAIKGAERAHKARSSGSVKNRKRRRTLRWRFCFTPIPICLKANWTRIRSSKS